MIIHMKRISKEREHRQKSWMGMLIKVDVVFCCLLSGTFFAGVGKKIMSQFGILEMEIKVLACERNRPRL